MRELTLFPLSDRYWFKVDKVTYAPCWIWLGRPDRDGYGQFRVGRQVYRAHRLPYEETHGPIKEGCEIHHTCETKNCVNPEHLESVPKGKHSSEHKSFKYGVWRYLK